MASCNIHIVLCTVFYCIIFHNSLNYCCTLLGSTIDTQYLCRRIKKSGDRKMLFQIQAMYNTFVLTVTDLPLPMGSQLLAAYDEWLSTKILSSPPHHIIWEFG